MAFSRRKLLQSVTAGAGTAALLQLSLAEKLMASPEPPHGPGASGAALNSNENPYGPLPSAMQAMQNALSKANRYPFSAYEPLAARIAYVNRIQAGQVMIGAGSTELLRICSQMCTAPGKNIVVADPTFEGLEHFADSMGTETRKVPLTSDFAHDLEAMLQRVDGKTVLLYICNPNNPTASITPASDIEAFLPKVPSQVTVLIDEAYHHFADGMPGYRSFINQTADRVIVLRTFSKIYGMAGLRLGYGVASIATAKKMSEYRLPISVNYVAAAGGVASLDDDAAMRAAAKRNAADREEFMRQAAARKVTVIPSFANFFMLRTDRPAKDVIAGFQQQNVLIGRPFPPMTDWIRVSLGLPEENKDFWQVWDQLRG
jgi:histidinol-phosphate aminotransferase